MRAQPAGGRLGGRRLDHVRARVGILACVVLAAAVGATSSAAGVSAAVTVTPATGGPRTVFTVRFVAPERTGAFGSQRRWDALSLAHAGSAPGSSCVSAAALKLAAAAGGSPLRLRLDPRRLGSAARWCEGAYDGVIREYEAPLCPPATACPQYILVVGVVGRFHFTVHAPTGGSTDTTQPAFAGLQKAFACTPGPQRPGETTPFALSWQAATDNVTPSSQIVYDIYLAGKPGGEDFTKPSWVSAPGATSFRTPGLPSHGSFYFVVRARDAAGNEDANTVELHGSDPCL
jgi:hypothetical protein